MNMSPSYSFTWCAAVIEVFIILYIIEVLHFELLASGASSKQLFKDREVNSEFACDALNIDSVLFLHDYGQTTSVIYA